LPKEKLRERPDPARKTTSYGCCSAVRLQEEKSPARSPLEGAGRRKKYQNGEEGTTDAIGARYHDGGGGGKSFFQIPVSHYTARPIEGVQDQSCPTSTVVHVLFLHREGKKGPSKQKGTLVNAVALRSKIVRASPSRHPTLLAESEKGVSRIIIGGGGRPTLLTNPRPIEEKREEVNSIHGSSKEGKWYEGGRKKCSPP